VSPADLSTHLRQFYAEAQPQNTNQRVQQLNEEQAHEYHKNTMKNVRAAINRHLKDIGRSIDIVRDSEFKPANAVKCQAKIQPPKWFISSYTTSSNYTR